MSLFLVYNKDSIATANREVVVQHKSKWDWCLEVPAGRISGVVEAIDPRDALSRALTSEVGEGLLLGEAHAIPVEVLQAAPGNFELSYVARGNHFALTVACQK